MATEYEPEGELVSNKPAISPDINSPAMTLEGTYITLRPLQLTDVPALYHSLCGPGNEKLWQYLPEGPFEDLEGFTKHMEFLCQRTMFFPFVLLSKNPAQIPTKTREEIREDGVPVGITTLMSIVPAHRRIEIGHVMYSSLLQRSPASTEASFLLMRLAFDKLGYDRVEWKCNDRNVPSMKAAERLGFVYEGTFRRHLVVKNRRRDTAWYSVVKDEWGLVRRVLEEWLRKENFESSGQKEKLEAVRERLGNLRQ